MVKAIDFWKYLCNELNYKFFSGVPCSELQHLYSKMSSEFMHYIPAIDIKISIGLSNGATMSGSKSAVLSDIQCIYKLDLDFNFRNSIPLLFISYITDNYNNLIDDIYNIKLTENMNNDLNIITNYVETELKPGILLIEKGFII